MGDITVLFRNDDVNALTPELRNVTRIFLDRGISITHTVEPGNVSEACVAWLKQMRREHGGLVEIVQHGWNHAKHGRGEFGDGRSYGEQYDDLARGRARMEELFGEDFFPMITIPFGVYKQDTVRACDALGYKVFCAHYNYRLSRRLFYAVGRLLGRGQLFGRGISNHLRNYPRTRMFEIDSAISFIKKYYDDYGTECEFETESSMLGHFERFERFIPVIVVLLHHRYHNDARKLQLVEDVVDALQRRPCVRFSSYRGVWSEYRS
ncbi:polysaccharide deacetylase family protein [bacterium]|nr:polysaccharide deacetylase family protein [bacterium]